MAIRGFNLSIGCMNTQATSICCCDRTQLTGKSQVLAFTNFSNLFLASLENLHKKSNFEPWAYVQALSFACVGRSEGCRQVGRAEQEKAQKCHKMNLSRIQGSKMVR